MAYLSEQGLMKLWEIILEKFAKAEDLATITNLNNDIDAKLNNHINHIPGQTDDNGEELPNPHGITAETLELGTFKGLTIDDVRSLLAEATTSDKGLLSAKDKENINKLLQIVEPSDFTVSGDTLPTRIDNLQELLNDIIGTDSAKTIRQIANEELVTQLIPEQAKDSLNTLQEISAWIQSHPDDASAMNSAIGDINTELEGVNTTLDNLDYNISTRVSKDGDTMTGTLTAPRYESIITSTDGKKISTSYYPTSYGNLYMALGQNDTVVNAMTLTPTYTRFNVPVEVYSGGTGANTAADARANLGITPENIGAVNSTGGKATGSLGIINGSWPTLGFYLDKDTITGSVYQAQSSRRVGINQRAENSNFSEDYLLPAPSIVESEADRPWYSILTSKNPVTIAQGGTGATTARGAQYAILNDMIASTDTVNDEHQVVFRTTAPNATSGVLIHTKMSSVWNYIAGKARNTFGFTSANVLPIANGGTGATTADAACNALGAVKKSGDTMTGELTVTANNIVINQGTAQKGFIATRTIDNLEHKTDYMMSSAGGPIIRYIIDGAEKNRMTLREDETAFHKPVNISSGGTGANSAAKARENLGVVSKSGDTITGALYRQGNAGAIGLAIGTASKPENVSIISVGDGTTYNRFAFRQYGTNGNRENFNLPNTTEPQVSINYDILTSKNAVTIAQGGTGATTKAGAVDSLMFLGNNPINTPSKDTITNWRAQGTGYAWYTTAGQINNQPSQWGVLINYSLGANDAFQLWGTAAGAVYHRSGNQSADLTTLAWKKLFDDSMTIPIANGGTGATTAAGARTNLGVVSKTGDSMTGQLSITHNTFQGLKLIASSTSTNKEASIGFFQNTTETWTLGVATGSPNTANFGLYAAGQGLVMSIDHASNGRMQISRPAYIKGLGVYGDSATAWASISLTDNGSASAKSRGSMMVSNVNELHFNVKQTNSNYAERYLLPAPATGLTKDVWYNILTTKTVVYSASQPAYAAGKIWLKPV